MSELGSASRRTPASRGLLEGISEAEQVGLVIRKNDHVKADRQPDPENPAGRQIEGIQCALHSLTDANFLSYGCVLVEDCCGTTSPPVCTEASLWNVKRIFGFVTDSSKIIAALQSRQARA